MSELCVAPNERKPDGSSTEQTATLSLADRFDTVLGAGRKIASALSKPAIYKEAQAAALRLLRGEHCLMIELDPAEGSEAQNVQLGDDEEGFDDRLLQRAVQTGRAVACVEEIAEYTSDQAGASGERSVRLVAENRDATATV